jgi:hypothetical protein
VGASEGVSTSILLLAELKLISFPVGWIRNASEGKLNCPTHRLDPGPSNVGGLSTPTMLIRRTKLLPVVVSM